MDKFKKFRCILESSDTTPIIESHNGISAMVAQEKGFQALWASGLTLSTSLGLRDCNELSWSQVLEQIEFMNDAVDIPILLDGDSGFGDFNTFRRVVKKLNDKNIAAVCIEDKIFPKRNSFSQAQQMLAPIEEFCSKIKAGKDSQKFDDFSIIARVEALICGYGLDEALKRADAYCQAGADGILIHSKDSTYDKIEAFANLWSFHKPLIIVPTKYYKTPYEKFRESKISIVIWANHLLRSSVSSMEKICQELLKKHDLSAFENEIAPLEKLFSYVKEEELIQAEKYYHYLESQEQNVDCN